MQKRKPKNKIYSKTATSFLATFILCALIGFIAVQNKIRAESEQMERLILEHVYHINQVISNQLNKTQALAALVIKGDGTVENFQEIAAAITVGEPALANVLLAPDGIVTDVYPIEQAGAVVGLNFFEETHAGDREAMLARDTGELVMAGPFILRQGILGLTGRYPVYIDTETEKNKFWGLVSVSLKFPEAIENAGLSMLEYQGLSYELWRINPDTLEKQVIAASDENSGPNSAYIERSFQIHNAEWYFRIYPIRLWYEYPETWLMLSVALSVSLFVAFIIQTQKANLLSAAKIQSELAEQIKQKELELTKGKVSIMLSQIKPHFLYNALTAIAQLCDENPAKAKKATIDFSSYLRNNMESLDNKGLISIEKELSHVKAYLDLEKAIYGKALNVVYNIQPYQFLLPPLTIQPIAENAVKHGIGKKEGGGTLTISIGETESDYLVTVSDDGAGYDVKSPYDDTITHLGIENVRRRIEEQCSGTLEVESEVGKGTRAEIRLMKGS